MTANLPTGPSTVTADAMPESFRLATKERWFDCDGVRAVRSLPGVDEIAVFQQPVHGYVAKITCG